MATHLLASHLTAKEVVGRFVLVAGLEAGEAETEAYVSAWKSGGGLLFGRNDPIVHTLVVSGFRTVDAELLCDKNARARRRKRGGRPGFAAPSRLPASGSRRVASRRGVPCSPLIDASIPTFVSLVDASRGQPPHGSPRLGRPDATPP